MSKELRVRMQQRYHPAEVWRTINPILGPGEIGIESDTNRFKYGDGKRTWKNLDYAFGSGMVSRIYANKNELPPAEEHPGEIAIIPQIYELQEGDFDITGQELEVGQKVLIDTPYISLRRSNKWFWIIFSDLRGKPLASSALDAFQLDTSALG